MKHYTFKTCQDCPELADKGERYCNACKKRKLNEMKEAGYLSTKGGFPSGFFRSSDQKEDTRDTKYGADR